MASWPTGSRGFEDHSEQKSQTELGEFVFRMIFLEKSNSHSSSSRTDVKIVKYIKNRNTNLNLRLDKPHANNISKYLDIYKNKCESTIFGQKHDIHVLFDILQHLGLV